MGTEHWWSDTDGKSEELGEKSVPVPRMHYKSHVNWAGIEMGIHCENAVNVFLL
jgi:hypothetical protein